MIVLWRAAKIMKCLAKTLVVFLRINLIDLRKLHTRQKVFVNFLAWYSIDCRTVFASLVLMQVSSVIIHFKSLSVIGRRRFSNKFKFLEQDEKTHKTRSNFRFKFFVSILLISQPYPPGLFELVDNWTVQTSWCCWVFPLKWGLERGSPAST